MNTYRWILFGGAAMVLAAACVVDSGTDNDDGNGGSGATSTTSMGGQGQGGTGQGGGTGGGSACDDGTPGSITDGVPDATCAACVICTQGMGAACESEWAACEVNSMQPCDAYLTCVDACETAADDPNNGGNGNGMLDAGTEAAFFDGCVGDPAAPAANTCVMDQAAGLNEYLAALSCSVCDNCAINCDAANNCAAQ